MFPLRLLSVAWRKAFPEGSTCRHPPLSRPGAGRRKCQTPFCEAVAPPLSTEGELIGFYKM